MPWSGPLTVPVALSWSNASASAGASGFRRIDCVEPRALLIVGGDPCQVSLDELHRSRVPGGHRLLKLGDGCLRHLKGPGPLWRRRLQTDLSEPGTRGQPRREDECQEERRAPRSAGPQACGCGVAGGGPAVVEGRVDHAPEDSVEEVRPARRGRARCKRVAARTRAIEWTPPFRRRQGTPG